jgi:hypothetical protein
MIEGQEVVEKLIRLFSVECQPTKAVLAQTCLGVFFIRSVSNAIFPVLFVLETPRTTASQRHSPEEHREPNRPISHLD